ncbi:MAG: hypothetical protein FJ291_28570 [Planctomycetes bacterium]|nr:hypothetical protein [Planctomycetota bacterium]
MYSGFRVFFACALLASAFAGAAEFEGTGRVDFHGYAGCVKLENESCRVVLCHQCGGRVLEYSWKGTNAMALHPDGAGKVYDPAKKQGGAADGGRFDIGPEKVIPPHPDLWVGAWEAEITGPRAARLTSVRDKATGVQLVRDFELDKASSRLRCTQAIRNVSDQPKEWCHWSRTFAPGGGIVAIPLSPTSRFPKHWVMYGGGDTIMYNPRDEQIAARDGFLLITGTPANPKLGMDSAVGWLAYLMKNGLLFVKRYPVYPDRAYNEVAGLTISIWYYKDELCELEPIGPKNNIAPGQSASFTEEWWILPHKYPSSPAELDLARLKAQVERAARQ